MAALGWSRVGSQIMDLERAKTSCSIEELCSQYLVCLELGQHGQVARLASRLVGRLIERLDEELETRPEEQEEQEETDAPVEEVELVSSLCKALRDQGCCAAAYQHLSDFVRLKDSLALAELVGAAPANLVGAALAGQLNQPVRLAAQFEQLVGVLRRAIHLLAFINQRQWQELNSSELKSQQHEEHSSDQDLWLEPGGADMQPLAKSSGVGFGTFSIQLNSACKRSHNPTAEHDIRWLIKRLDELAKRDDESPPICNGSKLAGTLCGPTVRTKLLGQGLACGYPLERFTVMVGLWIVALEAGHANLEQLVSELVDQLHHEEASSLDVDELLSLSQLGSFWLSRHKRFSASTKTRSEAHLDRDDDLEDTELDSCSSSASSEASEQQSLDGARTKRKLSLADHSLGAKLRRIIDDELLIGVVCPVCGQWPYGDAHSAGELLLPVKRDYCTKCRHRHSANRCAISFRPIQIISLESILAMTMQSSSLAEQPALVVVSAGEWARACLRASSKQSELLAAPGGSGGEQIEVTEKFERLKVIRDSDRWCEDITTGAEEQQPEEDQSEQYVKLLDTFMSRRACGNRQRSNHSQQLVGRQDRITYGQRVSESLLMIGSICGQKNPIKLPVCAVDLLQLDSTSTPANNFIRLCVAGTDDLADDQLWRCCMRSNISQVMLGCGRLYLALELIRSGCSKPAQFTCPYCQIHLISCSQFQLLS